MFSKEIWHCDQQMKWNKVVLRKAMRGILSVDGKLIVLYSDKVGDFSLPGGGMEAGETELEALHRELLEECGLDLQDCCFTEMGSVMEFSNAREAEDALFQMTSTYYYCDLSGMDLEFLEQKLEDYEVALDLDVRMEPIDAILAANRALLQKKLAETPRWVNRETMVFEILAKQREHYLLK